MRKPSIWYWVICSLMLLWSVIGVVDFTMTQIQNEAYLASYPQELLDHWFSYPLWVNAVWGVAVTGGLLGWGLMLLRRSLAVLVFILSLVAMLATFAYSFATGGMALQAEYGGLVAQLMTGLIVLLSIFAIWFARRARSKGTLR